MNAITRLSYRCYCVRSRCLLSTHADSKVHQLLLVDNLWLVIFWVFVRFRISPPRIKLAASNCARWFIGVLGRECPILLPRSSKSDE